MLCIGWLEEIGYTLQPRHLIDRRFHVLHLLRLNLIIYAAALVAGTIVLLSMGTPVVEAGQRAATVAGLLQLAALGVIFIAWKWIPGFSYWIFPNLSGHWTGKLHFTRDGHSGDVEAELDIERNLNTISMILETKDAESETIVVYPRRLTNRRLELLYVYETRRKEGRPPPFYRYRGTAVMRVEKRPTKLIGTYYTDQGGIGTVQFAKK
jgi:SMODS-associating 2TM, beta-strand rich effector domain